MIKRFQLKKSALNTLLLILIFSLVIFPYLKDISSNIKSWISNKADENKQREINRYLQEESLRKLTKARALLSERNITSITETGEFSKEVQKYLDLKKIVTEEKIDCNNPKEQYEKECSQDRFGCEFKPSSTLRNRIEVCDNLKNDTSYKTFSSEINTIRQLSSQGNITKDSDLTGFFANLKKSLMVFDQTYNKVQG